MKSKTCCMCTREVKPLLMIKATEYYQKKSIFSNSFVTRSRKVKLYFCSKCAETSRAIVRNNIAVKTSDIVNG